MEPLRYLFFEFQRGIQVERETQEKGEMNDQRQDEVIGYGGQGIQLYNSHAEKGKKEIEQIPGPKQRDKTEDDNQDINRKKEMVAWI